MPSPKSPEGPQEPETVEIQPLFDDSSSAEPFDVDAFAEAVGATAHPDPYGQKRSRDEELAEIRDIVYPSMPQPKPLTAEDIRPTPVNMPTLRTKTSPPGKAPSGWEAKQAARKESAERVGDILRSSRQNLGEYERHEGWPWSKSSGDSPEEKAARWMFNIRTMHQRR
jgi:hypothetical protein